MPTSYAYKVRDREGKMAAGSASSATPHLDRGREGHRPQDRGPAARHRPGQAPGLAVFSRQFATMIISGLPLLRALTILGEVVVQVRAEVEKGTSLSAAMARHPKVFNRLYVSMVRAGEIGGFLDQVLVKVAETFENLYASLGGTLPLPTRMLMGASQLLRRFFLVVALVFLFRRWNAPPEGPLPVGQVQAQGQGRRPAVPQVRPCRGSRAPWPP